MVVCPCWITEETPDEVLAYLGSRPPDGRVLSRLPRRCVMQVVKHESAPKQNGATFGAVFLVESELPDDVRAIFAPLPLT